MEGYAITRGRLSRYRLFWTKNIYDRQGAEQMFFSAVRENCAYHYRHCREYRKILRRTGFRPGHLECSRDIGRIPVLPTLFFKHHAIYSIAPECTWLKTTSSGTSGTASQVNFDGGALLCGLVYHKTKNLLATVAGEVFGTSVLGGLCAYPVAIFLMGKSAGDIAFYAYIVPFLISTGVGAVIAGILVFSLQRSGVLRSMQSSLS